jgi:hypothetical protein
MKSSYNLFKLIKSLSPTEKRYIKLAAQKKSSFKKLEFIKLFDVIDKMEVYDEDKLKERLKNSNIVSYLHSHKNYLEEYILRNVSSYNINYNIKLQLNETLNYIEVLYIKSQYDLCFKYIKKGIKIAEEWELNNYTLQFLAWEEKLLLPNKKGIKQIIHNVETQEEKTKIISEAIFYRSAYLKFTLFAYSIDSYAYGNEKQYINNLFEKYKLNEEPTTLTTEVSYYYYMSLYLHAGIVGKFKRRTAYINKAVETIENNKAFLKQNPLLYITALSGLVISYQLIGKSKLAFNTLEIAKTYLTKNKNDISQIIRIIAEIKITDATLYSNMVTGNIEAATQLENSVYELLKNDINKDFTSNQLHLAYDMAWAFFLIGKYEKTIDYTNEIIYK